jgi:hypothetical protein
MVMLSYVETFNLNIYANKNVFCSDNNTESEITDIVQTVI